MAAAGVMALAAHGAAAQGAMCEDPAGFCGRMLSTSCLNALGAGSLSVDADSCNRQFVEYRTCLASAAECPAEALDASAEPTPQHGGAGCSRDEEMELWTLASDENECAFYEAFVTACPDSRRVAFAQAKQTQLGCGGAVETAVPLPPAREEEPDCGYFAISFCDTQERTALARARAIGGYMINTSSPRYPKFRNGFFCVVEGPVASAEEARSLRDGQRRRGASDAYIKNSC